MGVLLFLLSNGRISLPQFGSSSLASCGPLLRVNWWHIVALRCPRYGGVDLDVTPGRALGRSFGNSFAVGGVIARGAGVKC